MNRQSLATLIAATALAGAAHAADIPKSLETMGIKIGDTQQQVEKVLFADGYKPNRTHVRPADTVYAARPDNIEYTVPNMPKRSRVTVTYGPMDGRVVQIERSAEVFEQKVLNEELRKQLQEKYGQLPPGEGKYGDMHWVRTKTGKSEFECFARNASITFAHALLMNKMLKCDKAVTVAIAGDSTWATAISVTIVDFDTALKNLQPIAAAAEKAKQDDINAAKKAPPPKL
ncbi:hypothetical protein [Duganella vulcania]|uniref:DUF4412 domain-containing protein n=1 Tax=Duganella vulcania TaxID=2692166 RepID=A0A845GT63_9BURK|nr:hypothetical protein [Duganella vulcania]MYM97211.1 hypothetical protein [Duganella vulcania]